MISKGPTYCGASFLFLLNHMIQFLGNSFKYTWPFILNYRSFLCLSVQLFCLFCASCNLSLIMCIFSVVLYIISSPSILFSPNSFQHNGERHGLQVFHKERSEWWLENYYYKKIQFTLSDQSSFRSNLEHMCVTYSCVIELIF